MQLPTIFQAIGFKRYTPNNEIVPYNFCTIYLTADCTVGVTDHFDNEDDVSFKAGYHPLMFKKIRTISGGTVYLCHNGLQPTLNELIYPPSNLYTSSPELAVYVYSLHAARVMNDGGIIDNPTVSLTYIQNLIDTYSFTSLSAINSKIKIAVETGVLGYKVGTGVGLTSGMAVQKLYSLNPTTDLVQNIPLNQPILLTHNGIDNYYFNSRSTTNTSVRTDNSLISYNNATDTLRFTARVSLNNQSSGTVDFVYTCGGAFIAGIQNKGTQFSLRFRGSANAVDSSNFTKPTNGLAWIRVTSSPTTITYEASSDNVSSLVSVVNWTALGTTARPALGAYSTTQQVCNSAGSTGNATAIYFGVFENMTTNIKTTFTPNLYNRVYAETTWIDVDCTWSILNPVATTGIKGILVDESKIAGDGIAHKMSATTSISQPYTVYAGLKRLGTGPVYGLSANSQLSNDATNSTLNNGTALNISNTSTAKQLVTCVVNDDTSSIQINNGLATTGDSGSNNGTYIDILANGATYGNYVLNSLMIVNGN